MGSGILVTSAGRRVSLLRAFQEAANESPEVSKVLACDLNPELSSACQAADASFVVPRVTQADYVDRLLEQCERHGVGLLVPTIDTELPVLAENRENFESRGIHIVVSDPALIESCADKVAFADFIEQFGIPAPKVVEVEQAEFPLFIKQRFGSSSIGARVVDSSQELPIDAVDDGKWILQELVDTDLYDEFTIDLYYAKQGELMCAVPRLRIETRAGEVSKGRTDKGWLYEFLVEKLAHVPGARGCLTLQVFAAHDRSQVVAIEINPRFGGGFPLSQEAGANFPKWLIEEYLLGQAPEFFDSWEPNLTMLRYDDAVFVR